MRIAVIGSRCFNDYTLLETTLNEYESITKIISGGAVGADTLAETFANNNKIAKEIYLPNWGKYGVVAGRIRNRDIVKASELVIAFWDGKSRGTKSSIDYAEMIGVPVRIILM